MYLDERLRKDLSPDIYCLVHNKIVNLEQQSKKQKEVIDKAIEYINDNLTISSILDGKKYYTINNYSFDYKELLDILNEVSE